MAKKTVDEERALTKMRGLTFGFSITLSIAQAVELGIADLLAEGPRTTAELARRCGVRYPSVRCTCFDLARAEQAAVKTFQDSSVTDRCNFVGGDFFEDVPVGADAYLLSAVVHDWGNEQCLQILRNVGAAFQITEDFWWSISFCPTKKRARHLPQFPGPGNAYAGRGWDGEYGV